MLILKVEARYFKGDDVDTVTHYWVADVQEVMTGSRGRDVYPDDIGGAATIQTDAYDGTSQSGRLIEVKTPSGWQSFLISRAWLMGPDGGTIDKFV